MPESVRLAWLRLQVRQLRLAVRWQLRQRDRARAEATFARLMSAWVHLGRRQLLASEHEAEPGDELAVPRPGSEWLPDRRDSLPACGFHTLESWQGHRFRWSEPAAMLWLPPLEGPCTLRIEWAPFQAVDGPMAARFYLNERPIPPDSLAHREHHTEITWTGSGPHGLRLSWACSAVDSAGDERQLGLPVSRVSWSAGPEQQAEPTLYLLHVDKCAGTSTRHVLMNDVPASGSLAGFETADFYYARQLKDHPEIRRPYAFAVGHFGWELPSRVSDRRWRIVTMLREPLERLLSLHGYLRQHSRLESQVDFVGWLEGELRVRDVMQAHFVPGAMEAPEVGVQAIGALLQPHLPAALANLRSCEAVGLQERMEDSINLLCAATGCLAPRCVPSVNVTLQRTRRTETGAHALQLFESHLVAERELYGAARSIFGSQLERLHERLSEEAGHELDTAGVRAALRRRYFARRSDQLAAQGPAHEIRWSPADGFPGHNLHDRERHDGQILRWSGPDPETSFYFPLNGARRSRIELKLHPATPGSHAEAARLTVNGQPVALRCQSASDGYTLTGSWARSQPPDECGLLSEFTLSSPTVRGAGEFRELGLALQAIRITSGA